MARKFFKTVIQVTILSEDAPFEGLGNDDDPFDLEAVNYAITEGHCLGDVKTVSTDELTGKQAADLCYEVGSEPQFFNLQDDGTDEEDL